MAKKAGRPAGSKNRQYDQATVPAVLDTTTETKCPRCGSTDREPYFHKTEQEIDGIHEGQIYTRVVWRRTKCRACEQYRSDKSYEAAD
jgi:hypothetical protein